MIEVDKKIYNRYNLKNNTKDGGKENEFKRR